MCSAWLAYPDRLLLLRERVALVRLGVSCHWNVQYFCMRPGCVSFPECQQPCVLSTAQSGDGVASHVPGDQPLGRACAWRGGARRAEKSFTHRHLCEFVGLDLEMAIDEHYSEVLDVLDRLFVYIFSGLRAKFGARHARHAVPAQPLPLCVGPSAMPAGRLQAHVFPG